MDYPPEVSDEDARGPGQALRQAGREAAVEGLLYGDFADSGGLAGARALSALRAEVEAGGKRPERAFRTSRLVRAIRGGDHAEQAAGKPASSARAPAASPSGSATRSPIWRRAMRRAHPATLASAAVAAMLVVAVAAVLLFGTAPPDERTATVISFNGAVAIVTGSERHPASRNDLLAPGSLLVTGAMSSARLRYDDGTVLDVTANARLGNLEGALAQGGQRAQGAQKALRLEAGTVHAEVAHQPEGRPLIIATADAEALVLGTRLILDTKTSDTRLSVEKGLVRLVRTADRRSVEVPAGKRVVAEETGALIVQDSPTPPPPVERSSSPVHDGGGSGLTGDYFNGIELSERVLTRIDPVIDFDWGFESAPVSVLHSEFYSVRWHGEIEPRFSEDYLVSTLSDDGVRLWIDGKLLIDNWFEHPELAQSAHVELSAGRRYAIVLEYCEWKRYALVHLYWQSRHQAREVVPRCQLYPADPAPALTK